MDYFKNKVCLEVEFVSEWPDTAEEEQQNEQFRYRN